MVSDMTLLVLSYALAQVPLAMAASLTDAEQAVAIGTARTNRAIVERAFVDWQSGQGYFYDSLTPGASVTISGHIPLFKAEFQRDRAQPFQARFSTPILATHWKIWADDDEVIVRWESRATACDGKPYANSYAYFITMKNGRAEALTMFLDMSAFDDVWKRCPPANQRKENQP